MSDGPNFAPYERVLPHVRLSVAWTQFTLNKLYVLDDVLHVQFSTLDAKNPDLPFMKGGTEYHHHIQPVLTESEALVNTFLALRALVIHEFAEMFHYKGGTPFDPHSGNNASLAHDTGYPANSYYTSATRLKLWEPSHVAARPEMCMEITVLAYQHEQWRKCAGLAARSLRVLKSIDPYNDVHLLWLLCVSLARCGHELLALAICRAGLRINPFHSVLLFNEQVLQPKAAD